MSIKLYNGYIFHANPFDKIDEIREAFQEHRNSLARKALTNFIVREFDKKTLGVNHRTMTDIMRYGPLWMPRNGMKVNSYTWKDYADAMLSPQLTFTKNKADEYSAQLWDVEGSLFRELWESFDYVEPFPYWDSTDPPDNLTEWEWSQRKEWWAEMLRWDKGQYVPSQVALAYSFVDDIVFNGIGLEESDKPSVEMRKEYIKLILRKDDFEPRDISLGKMRKELL